MNPYTVAELHELSKAILEAGPGSFVVKRVLQRVEAGELSVKDATELLRRRDLTPNPCQLFEYRLRSGGARSW